MESLVKLLGRNCYVFERKHFQNKLLKRTRKKVMDGRPRGVFDIEGRRLLKINAQHNHTPSFGKLDQDHRKPTRFQ